MTTIVCLRRGGKTIMGADMQTALGWQCCEEQHTKIFRLGANALLGLSGRTASCQLLHHDMASKKDMDVEAALSIVARKWALDAHLSKMSMMAIIATAKDIYYLGGDGGWERQSKPYLAIGTGNEFARGALESMLWEDNIPGAQEVVYRAMKIAAKCDLATGNTAMFLEL